MQRVQKDRRREQELVGLATPYRKEAKVAKGRKGDKVKPDMNFHLPNPADFKTGYRYRGHIVVEDKRGNKYWQKQ